MIKALKSMVRPFVKTLVYFSSPDLMVEVTYKKIRNSIKYASHREMLFRERFGVEHYLLSNLAVKMGLPILLCLERIEDRVRTGTFLDRVPGLSARLSLNERQCRGQEIGDIALFSGLGLQRYIQGKFGHNLLLK